MERSKFPVVPKNTKKLNVPQLRPIGNRWVNLKRNMYSNNFVEKNEKELINMVAVFYQRICYKGEFPIQNSIQTLTAMRRSGKQSIAAEFGKVIRDPERNSKCTVPKKMYVAIHSNDYMSFRKAKSRFVPKRTWKSWWFRHKLNSYRFATSVFVWLSPIWLLVIRKTMLVPRTPFCIDKIDRNRYDRRIEGYTRKNLVACFENCKRKTNSRYFLTT